MVTPMHAINSAPGAYGDDSDITIINPSMMGDEDHQPSHTYVPIIDRLKQATNSAENRNNDANETTTSRTPPNRQDYIFVDHNPEENAQQLEQVLQYYIQDLKQENRTHLDCAQQLTIRLIDLIRPAYSKDQKKMIELDGVLREISALHDQRHVDQNEKLEQLRSENSQLQKLLFNASNPSSLSLTNRNYSLAYQEIDPQANPEQWTEIEDDAKKLQEMVQQQQERINEIVTLLNKQSPTEVETVTPNQVAEEELPSPIEIFEEPSAVCSPSENNSLLARLKNFMKQKTTPLINHSPGSSPTHSFSTLTINAINSQVENPIEPEVPIGRESCPSCQREFVYTCEKDRIEMHDHFQDCLFPQNDQAASRVELTEYSCPECEKKYGLEFEHDYLQHMVNCYNRE